MDDVSHFSDSERFEKIETNMVTFQSKLDDLESTFGLKFVNLEDKMEGLES
jgi:hypothetical protein